MSRAVGFPWSAVVGQDALREALLACAVDPRIGGVLVRGERGTAKSTAVRALAPLLPDVAVFEDCAYAVEPRVESCPDGPHDGSRVVERPARLVELPLGATADRVVGTLDLDRALAEGAAAFAPGLLAQAHRGILYVDEVNLLADHLVDVLLDSAALGHVHVERDAVSVDHPARFLLVGTMNPEEGDLRPQLLDRFGLSVEVRGSTEQDERMEVVRRRLAFDADPAGFAASFAADDAAVAARVADARDRLSSVRLGDRALALITSVCASLGVDGLRADIVCARTAVALAALDGVDEVAEEHVRRAAMLALAHRRRRGPLEQPGLSSEELDDAIANAAGGPDDEPEPPGSPSGGGAGSGEPRGEGGSSSEPAPSGVGGGGPAGEAGEGPGRADADPVISGVGDRSQQGRGGSGAKERRERAAAPGVAPLLALEGRGAGAPGRRSAAGGEGTQPVDSRPPLGAGVRDLAVAATLRAAAQRRATSGGPALAASDLREHVRAGREGNLVVFCVDASGSMGARRRMAAVKGAVLGLLLDAYQRRDRVALVTFRGTGAELVLPPTSSVERAAALLDDVATGGRTPLAAGLDRAGALVAAEQRKDPRRRALVLVVTDGRASGGPEGRAAAERSAAALARSAGGVVVFDAEEGAVRLGLARRLADAAGARLLPLSALHPASSTIPSTAARSAA
ncbi:VWA domain-containing protein [Conexibacter sp. SYSU D00693]|uniref:VWA domain-containing protein n=1 Tax=Conexibacter sp. SYSU D00693 TaxID=2812560 RepID=UPI00196A97EC|nr:VWA domain-containing protein [Conexibacter sp. SYSU D00693]